MKEKDFEIKIMEALEDFKQGYRARNIETIDAFIERLFYKSDKTAVLGTSFGEWMIGQAGAKEIVESDWRYWGDVDIDTANVNVTFHEDTAFVNLKGTVRYEFEYTDAKFDSYLNFVKHFFDPADSDYRMSPKVKAGHISFVLTHFNQIRKEGKREYFYPLRINAVMTMQEDRAIFRFMKFSMDTYSQYPELRIDGQMMDMSEYYEQQKDFAKEHAKENRAEAKAAAEHFTKFIAKGFNGADNAAEYAEEYFSQRKDNYVIDTRGNIHRGQAIPKIMKDMKAVWSKLAVDERTVFSDVNGSTAWIACNGLASHSISEQEGAEALMKQIQKIAEKDCASKDKLFAIQKQVADYFLQYSKGECFLWPIRAAAMLIKENEQWKLHGVSISYPFYYILEGKYDAASMI